MKKIWMMVALFAVTGVVFLAAETAFGADYQVTKKAGEYSLDLRFDRNPPVAGRNNVTIEIRDRAGKLVTDADVSLHYSMPPMPGMAPMNYRTTAPLKGQRYAAVVDLSMPGSWNLVVRIARGDQVQTARFTVDAK